MLHALFPHKSPSSSRSRVRSFRSLSIAVLYCLFIGCLLVACGASTTGAQTTTSGNQATPTPTPTFTPTPTPTFTPTPTPTPKPKPKPTQPPPPPQSAPATLDLQPASMSFVGHLDCNKSNGAYVCTARVLSRSSNQSNLHWTSFTNVPGNIVFSPASGVLTPGTSVLVHISIPTNDCTQGLFFFRGPINTHTITWAC